jgi:site-specific DNA recombinase
MRVAIYRRISTDEDHQPYSLEAQEQRLRSYIDSQPGWELVRTFTDQASGATLDRPDLQRALTEARARRYDLLLVYRVDRFARSVRGLASLLEALDQVGVAFRSATEPFDTTTAAGRMMVQMLAVFAEFERATIIDRVISGMERKAARGEWCGGSRPYGYVIDPANGHLRVEPGEAPVVRTMFDLYTKKHLGAQTIANQLNSQGHRTKAGRPWNTPAVLTVLRNRAYLGEVYFRDRYHAAPHKPLISQAVFDDAQQILAARSDNHSLRASNGSDYLLAGLVVCTRCGARFVGGSATGSRYRYRYYTCFTRQRYGTAACDAERLNADQLDQAVLERLAETYADTRLIDRAVQAAKKRASEQHQQAQDNLAGIDTELAKTEQAIERYLLAFEAGTLPEAACGQRIQALADKTAALRDHRAVLADQLDGAQETPTPQGLELIRQRVADAITRGDVHAQKHLLQVLVHEIRAAARNEIQPIFKIPTAPGTANPKVRKQKGSVPPARLERATHGLGNRRSIL